MKRIIAALAVSFSGAAFATGTSSCPTNNCPPPPGTTGPGLVVNNSPSNSVLVQNNPHVTGTVNGTNTLNGHVTGTNTLNGTVSGTNTNYFNPTTTIAPSFRLGTEQQQQQHQQQSQYSLSNATGGSVRLGDGALSPTATSSLQVAPGAIRTGDQVVQQGDQIVRTGDVAVRQGDQNVSINNPRNTPMAYAPGVNPAQSNGCFGAKWGISIGGSAPGGAGSIGFTPSQEWNKECDESGDRRILMTSGDPLERATGIAASTEKFEGIKKGLDTVAGAVDTYYEGGKKDLPKSGIGILLGLQHRQATTGHVTTRETVRQPVAIQSVTVNGREVVRSEVCVTGKWNAQTQKCEPN